VPEIRVLVVDDHSLFREGVVNVLEREADMMIVGQADSVGEAVAKALETSPDVILMDLRLPDGSGLEAAREIRRNRPGSAIVMLTVVEDEGVLIRALKDGARGYALKGVSGNELVRVVRSVVRGETYVSPHMGGRMIGGLARGDDARRGECAKLAERERAILDLVAAGNTNKEIADRLFLSEKTVKYYMTAILRKLGARNRVEAALLAVRENNSL
jgi:DNA-binding NarL/FixJ family response regulator